LRKPSSVPVEKLTSPAVPAKLAAEDIPIAHRERYTPEVTTLTHLRRQRKFLTRWLYFFMGITSMASLIALGTYLFSNKSQESSTAAPASTATPTEDTVLGHFRYPEAPTVELKEIGGGLKLRKSAAAKFQAMVGSAKAAGVNIATISAFRSVADQQRLFFEVKAQRAQVTTKRAEVSAPPNYSEHHTGYAVDLSDANAPGADLKPDFENTKAFKWLQANAPRYSFELSFPQGNTQGVSYEPWHWRYVGDSASLETFYRAKKPVPSAQP
jgi:zinc D-Ala-D-Ala carboxypeptidase